MEINQIAGGKLDKYIPIVGQTVVDELKLLADRLKNKVIQHINSTAVGGGVAEILTRMVPLMEELGLDARWDLIKGGADFFAVTKKFHNVLHGKQEEVTEQDFDIFMETSRENIDEINITGDIVVIHDPQPIALIKKKLDNKWIWRCHIDVSKPHEAVWEFLKTFVNDYNASIFSALSSRPVYLYDSF